MFDSSRERRPAGRASHGCPPPGTRGRAAPPTATIPAGAGALTLTGPVPPAAAGAAGAVATGAALALAPALAVALAACCLAGAAAAQPLPAALAPDLDTAFYITPNGSDATGPYAARMLGAGADTLGGGTTMKVGFATSLWYMRFTRGPGADYAYDPLYSPPGATLAGPPDLTDRNQLPPAVLDHLEPGFDIGRLPRLIAWFEWARYLDVPIVFHLNGGPIWGEGWPNANNVMFFLEQQDKLFCQWNEDDLLDPDDDPTTFDMPPGDGRSFATLTYASNAVAQEMGITLLHRHYKRRNLQAAVAGLLQYGALPRYAGRVAAVTLDSEHQLNTFQDLATGRRWYADYNPIVIRQFQLWLAGRYGDSGPAADSNGDGATFDAEFAAEYLASGNVLHPHAALPASWDEVDPPRNPDPDLWMVARDPDRYWMLWTDFREALVDGFVDEVAGWVTAAGMPGRRVFSHQNGGAYWMFKNRVIQNQPPLDLGANFQSAELDRGAAGFNHYQPYNAGSGYYYFSTYRRIDPDWAIPEYNPYVIQPGLVFATPEQVWAHVQAAYTNGAHLICPHAWGSTSYPVVDWTIWSFQSDLQGWTPNADLHHLAGRTFVAIGPDPQLVSPAGLAMPADSVRFVTARLRTPPGGTTVALYFRRTQDAAFDSTRVLQLPLKNMPTDFTGPYFDGWAEYAFEVSTHAAWTGVIDQLRLDPTDAALGELLIDKVATVGPNPYSSALAELVAAHEGEPRPDPTPPATTVAGPPFHLGGLIGDASFELYGTGTDGDFDPAGDFEAQPVTAGGLGLLRAILAPPPPKLGQWLAGTFRLALPPEPLALEFRVGLADSAPASDDGVRFVVTLRDAGHRLWHLADLTWWDQAWSPPLRADLAAFAGQEVTLALLTHAVADTVGDAAAWGQPVLVEGGGTSVVGDEASAASGRGATRTAALALAITATPGPAAGIVLALAPGGAGGRVRVTVHDAAGRMVRVLLDAALPAGRHRLAWDGRSGRGGRLPAGVYFVRATAGDATARAKLVHR